MVVQNVLKEHGGDDEKAIAFWMEPVTIAELNKLRKKHGVFSGVDGKLTRTVVRTATGQDKMIPRSFFFGPKIGAYTLNLQRDSRYTTVDVWEARLARSYCKGMFDKRFGLPADENEMSLFLEWGAKVSKELGFSRSAGHDRVADRASPDYA